MKDDLIPLRDILKEIEFHHSIRDRTDYDGFRNSSADVRAASYAVMVISEAVRRIPEAWLAEQPDTPWHAIRSIGNKLRHEYQRVSDVIIWGIISTQSNGLKAAVEAIIAKHERH
ncbi:MAG: HepT-like ribonuclease domain-containing protein [Pseudomonadota bacterium]